MDEYNDIRALLKPRRDVKASAQLRSRVKSDMIARRTRRSRGWLWGGISAAVAAAVLILIFVPTGATARSSHDLLQASLSTIAGVDAFEMELEVRTSPNDNFSYIDPEADFVKHHISVERTDSVTVWRLDKGSRKAMHNRQGTYLWIESLHCGWYSQNPQWKVAGSLSVFLSPSQIMEAELALTLNDKQAKYNIDKNGNEIILTIHSMPNGDFTNPYMLNHSIAESESYRRYVIDAESKQLKSAVVSFVVDGQQVEMIRLTSIMYGARNRDIAALPRDIDFINLDQQVRTEGISGVNAKEAASIIFNAFKNWNMEILGKVLDDAMLPVTERTYRGAELINLGEPFKSGNDPNMTFVPYTVRFSSGEIKEHNLSLTLTANDSWIITGGL
jgi:hypothetical protein